MSEPLRSGDKIAATAWCEEDVRPIEGGDVEVSAELCDVDEVALVVEWFDVEDQQILVHLNRVQAIALAGQLASAATRSPVDLPHGHGPEGALS